jgi:hypothetical protein
MYDDREVVVQAPQDVLERSPGWGVRLTVRWKIEIELAS